MSGIEIRDTSPEEFTGDTENSARLFQKNKYAYQIGLKDLDFDLDFEKLKSMGINIPFRGIIQAEQALSNNAIFPNKLIEDDNTEHQVLVFDHRPVGFSGFMNCVTHSLVLTNHGLFEVGRYPAMSLSTEGRYWQWFIHRRLANVEEVNVWCENQTITPEQLVQGAYKALTQE
jgi:hypothetical protein